MALVSVHILLPPFGLGLLDNSVQQCGESPFHFQHGIGPVHSPGPLIYHISKNDTELHSITQNISLIRIKNKTH